jgi:hypothetical protein
MTNLPSDRHSPVFIEQEIPHPLTRHIVAGSLVKKPGKQENCLSYLTTIASRASEKFRKQTSQKTTWPSRRQFHRAFWASWHQEQSKEKLTVNETRELQDKLDLSEAKNRLNNRVAISVAIISVFMGITKVKDDNIVQTMIQVKSDAVDRWNEYQSTRIKSHMAELGLNQVKALRAIQQGTEDNELPSQQKSYEEAITRYRSEGAVLSNAAKGFEKHYDDLNYRDDQFDLSDAALSISLAMLAITSLAGNRKLLILAWVFGGFGLIMGLAGLAGFALHPDELIKFLT